MFYRSINTRWSPIKGLYWKSNKMCFPNINTFWSHSNVCTRFNYKGMHKCGLKIDSPWAFVDVPYVDSPSITVHKYCWTNMQSLFYLIKDRCTLDKYTIFFKSCACTNNKCVYMCVQCEEETWWDHTSSGYKMIVSEEKHTWKLSQSSMKSRMLNAQTIYQWE